MQVTEGLNASLSKCAAKILVIHPSANDPGYRFSGVIRCGFSLCNLSRYKNRDHKTARLALCRGNFTTVELGSRRNTASHPHQQMARILLQRCTGPSVKNGAAVTGSLLTVRLIMTCPVAMQCGVRTSPALIPSFQSI